jgi:hypothetical protein
MSAKIIPFPSSEEREQRDNIMVQGSGAINYDECSEMVHYFDMTPGRCHCGQKFWDPPNEPEDRDVPA